MAPVVVHFSTAALVMMAAAPPRPMTVICFCSIIPALMDSSVGRYLNALRSGGIDTCKTEQCYEQHYYHPYFHVVYFTVITMPEAGNGPAR
jgi:hypothetical protein